ncbi:MAG: EAL domain-containing response regulator [Ilumatobacteraceae bacterium]
MPDSTPQPITDRSAPTIAPLVLVADDDPVQRRLLQAILEHAGYRVALAVDGADTLAALAREQPDIALIDAMMPGRSGLDVVAALRAEPGFDTLPVIMISSHSDMATKVESFASGVSDYLVKPVDGTELVARVRAQLRAGDRWTGHLSRSEQRNQSVFRTLSQTELGSDPFETARRLLDRMPAELGCSALVAVADGRVVPLASSIEGSDLTATLLELDWGAGAERQRVIQTSSPWCPMCGRDRRDGRITVTRLTTFTASAALLLSGCSSAPDSVSLPLAQLDADACAPVLCGQFGEWRIADGDRCWVDDVIARQRFDVKYQPIVELRTGTAVAFEALARFPDGLDPESAFAMAARTDRGVALQLAVVREAIRRGRALPHSAALHCNVSPLAAAAPELASILCQAGRKIVIEITEHELIETSTVDLLREFAPSTASIAVDDVGAGYAGLSLLLRLRPDEIKIDRVIVSGVDADPARQALVAGLVRFALATRANLIAEGIERAEELRCLLSLGVELGQGYLFAPAMDISDAATLRPFSPPGAN